MNAYSENKRCPVCGKLIVNWASYCKKHCKNSGRYVEGNVPWSIEGLKGVHSSPDTEIKKGEHKSLKTEFKKGNTVGSKALNKYWEKQGFQSDTETIFFITQLLSLFPHTLVERQFYFDDFYHPFDFAIPSAHLVFEIDGKQHILPEIKKRDAEIDNYIENKGWKMIRHTNQQVWERDYQKKL